MVPIPEQRIFIGVQRSRAEAVHHGRDVQYRRPGPGFGPVREVLAPPRARADCLCTHVTLRHGTMLPTPGDGPVVLQRRTGTHAGHIGAPQCSEAVSYTHLTLPTNREV